MLELENRVETEQNEMFMDGKMVDLWKKIERCWNPLYCIMIFIPHNEWGYFEIVKEHLDKIKKRWMSEEIFWILPEHFKEEAEKSKITGKKMYVNTGEEYLLMRLYECCEISKKFFLVKLNKIFGRKKYDLISDEENILNGIFLIAGEKTGI